ncbi:hypothetical protein HISP_14375 [Haloarcula hispanica N601]|jgi:hypothetical protein|uniref:DUF8053 domain-containing protein n=7 Tax=Haloarcula TaxID=2237 RepID=A0A830ETS5_9EURY|nr:MULTISPECIES: hypothetical protein [Haloarcula]QRG24224.1 hypothetical protein HarHp1_140 [Haloarcula virus Harhisp1]AEM58407.1 conserved hypothetical protein [Haloarcula hispanica ATCC 33960]AHB67134.1 hypothetical protein HISP_14375 [Haloarcula hispanica N601]AUG48536.1 hypothetical protein BVU17_13745 [Haloarcula taiwanensis]EMA20012.1 hypothetical protein C443_14287 [Haloarcula argentinensis DSM 12282]
MEMRKLSPAGGCVTVSIPIDDLRERGVVDEDGELVGNHWAKVESLDQDDEGDYRLELVSP